MGIPSKLLPLDPSAIPDRSSGNMSTQKQETLFCQHYVRDLGSCRGWLPQLSLAFFEVSKEGKHLLPLCVDVCCCTLTQDSSHLNATKSPARAICQPEWQVRPHEPLAKPNFKKTKTKKKKKKDEHEKKQKFRNHTFKKTLKNENTNFDIEVASPERWHVRFYRPGWTKVHSHNSYTQNICHLFTFNPKV